MTNRNTPRRAAIYARISSDPDDKRAGVDRQLADCRALAERNGWPVAAEYVDNDVSAYSGTERPEYTRMLADLDAGRIDAVLAWHPDRIARRLRELVAFLESVEKRGAQVATVTTGEVDISTASGRLNTHVLAAISEYESAHRSERIRRAHRQRAIEGRPLGGRRCYGYEFDYVTVRESEAAEVKSMIAALLRGESLRSIVADLNARGVVTAYGKKWTSTAVRELLKAPRIAGLSAHHGEVVGVATWPPLVSQAEWYAAQAILDDPSRRTNNRGNAVRYLGSGLYRCGVCGSADMRVSHTSDGRHRYRCRNRVKGDPVVHVGRDQPKLDAYVEAVLIERLSQPDVAEAIAKRQAGTGVDVGALNAQRRRLVERRDQLAVMFAEGTVSASALAAGTAKVDAELERIDAELAATVERSPLAGLAGRDDVAELWDGLTLGRKRVILDALVTVVVLPTKSGRNADGAYFRPEDIRFDWK